MCDPFESAPRIVLDTSRASPHVEEIFVTDAYLPLAIEGYRVSAELMERVRSGGVDH